MSGRKGLKQSKKGQVVRDRPALNAGLNKLVAVVGEYGNCSATVMIDQIVRAGFESMGLGHIASFAEAATVRPDAKEQDLEALGATLRSLVSRAEVAGMQLDLEGARMAS